MADNVFEPTERTTSTTDLDPAEQITLYLAQTRPWVGLMSVLMLLSTLLMTCGGISMTLMMGTLASTLPRDELGPFGFVAPFFGVIYLVIAAIYAVPTFLLGRYTLAAGPADLHEAAQAIRYQRDFWRVVGVMAIVFIALYCGGIAAVVAFSPR
ncbi:MAG: hypothetical protein R3F59_16015 [Myxococcota bacterium]